VKHSKQNYSNKCRRSIESVG